MIDESGSGSSSLEEKFGFGGWLAFFQIRIYIGLASMLQIVTTHYIPLGYKLLDIVIIALSVGTLILFYRKQAVFKIVYIFTVIAVIIMYLIIHEYYYLIASAIVETIIIIALFRSARVKNTFGQ